MLILYNQFGRGLVSKFLADFTEEHHSRIQHLERAAMHSLIYKVLSQSPEYKDDRLDRELLRYEMLGR